MFCIIFLSLIELEKHTKNPGDCWGRYSSRSVSNKCPDSSENNPEDE